MIQRWIALASAPSARRTNAPGDRKLAEFIDEFDCLDFVFVFAVYVISPPTGIDIASHLS